MICVYFVSYVPALLTLRISGYEAGTPKLMFYLVLIVQLSDVLQYVWGKSLGRHPVAPSISPGKTWEGLVGGVACATALGTGIWWASPFSPGEAALISLAITLMGFAGGLIMSAIKRDRGVKDYGALIGGHGGSDRFAVLLRAGVLPPDAVLLRVMTERSRTLQNPVEPRRTP
jgi:phosphatidate cytidylyltransferase